MVQYRKKDFQFQTDLEEAYRIREICKKYEICFLVNDRVDLALALDADGVHLGQSDMPPLIARNILGEDKFIGLSIGTKEEFRQVAENSALASSLDYIALSPVFFTNTKRDLNLPWGISGIYEVSRKISIPLVGIGGINETNVSEVVKAGIGSVAVVSAICSQDSPRQASENLNRLLLSAYKEASSKP